MTRSFRLLFMAAAVFAVFRCASGQAKLSPQCQLRAAPPPMATLGGPATAAPGQTELGLGVGVFGEGFGNTCAIDMTGVSNWFARWRRGVTDRTDLGFDALIGDSGQTLTGTTKLAARFQATRGLRLEGGIGAADSGDGRSLNSDAAAVIGTNRYPDNAWNYYASLRLAASHGCFNLLCIGGEGAPGSRAPGALIPLGAIGSTARVSSATRFVMEGGLGEIFSRQQPHTGLYIHVAFGVQFLVGGDHRRQNRAAAAGD